MGFTSNWSKEEIDFIQDNVASLTNKQIAEKLGRSVASIKGKLREFKKVGLSTRIDKTEKAVDNKLEGEIWQPYDEMYSVSNYGRVKNRITGVLRKISLSNNGYPRLTMRDNKATSVHRMVAEKFVKGQTAERNSVNHIDGNKTNNFYKNLEWLTPRENVIHAFETGLNEGTKKVSEKELKKLLSILYFQKYTASEVREMFDNNFSVHQISYYRTKLFKGDYSHLGFQKIEIAKSEKAPRTYSERKIITPKEKQAVLELLKKGVKNTEIATILGGNVTVHNVHKIKKQFLLEPKKDVIYKS